MRIYHYLVVEFNCYENLYKIKLNESWIIDRVIDEWKSNNDEITSKTIDKL